MFYNVFCLVEIFYFQWAKFIKDGIFLVPQNSNLHSHSKKKKIFGSLMKILNTGKM